MGKYGKKGSDPGKHDFDTGWVRFRSDFGQISVRSDGLVNALTADRVRFADRVSPVSS